MSHRERLEDLNRRDLNLTKAQVKDVLPEYFQSEYPKLINLLEAYYEYLDSDGQHSFDLELHNLLSSHDINQTSDDNLDQWWNSIGNGLSADLFYQNPRLMAKMMGDFYRMKGTLNGGTTFFRAFFNEEAQIEYPKENILIVGESKIIILPLCVILIFEALYLFNSETKLSSFTLPISDVSSLHPI